MQLLHNLRKSLKVEVILSILAIVALVASLNYYGTLQIKVLRTYSNNISEFYLPSLQAVNKIEYFITKLTEALDILYYDSSGTKVKSAQVEAESIVAELSIHIQTLETINQTVNNEEFHHLYADVKTTWEELTAVKSSDNRFEHKKIKDILPDLTDKIDILATTYNKEASLLAQINQEGCQNIYLIHQISGTITLLFSFFIMFLMIRSIVTPTVKAASQLHAIVHEIQKNKGDLSARIEVKKENEIGILINGINLFIDQLQKVMLDIRSHSNNLQQSAANINIQTKDANERVSDIAATMEELSATMEEVSSTVTEMNAGADNIMSTMKQINEQSNTGFTFAGEMKERAIKVQYRARDSHHSAQQMIDTINVSLNKAITNSKKVNRIEELTEDILKIASQTNLLALNASIEAARAGEAGRGFSVVADQIRLLASESQQTANNIQEISQTVLNAVHQLTNNAEEMLYFTGNTVMQDYEVFLDTTKQYQADAAEMAKEMTYFRQQTDGLKETLAHMTNGINNIAFNINESSKNIHQTACAVSEVNSNMYDIGIESQTNNSISQELASTVARFKKI